MLNYQKYIFVELLILINLSSCVYPTPHENFKSHMNFNLGKNVNDPLTHLARYPEKVVGSKLLPNGNLEKEFLRNEICTVFFEIDTHTGIITKWRYKGDGENCRVTP